MFLFVCLLGSKAHPHRTPCRDALACKLEHYSSMYGMNTASDSTRRSMNTTRWFRTCPNFVLGIDFCTAKIVHRAWSMDYIAFRKAVLASKITTNLTDIVKLLVYYKYDYFAKADLNRG